MSTGNTPRSAICCAAQRGASALAFGGHPLVSRRAHARTGEGQNRGVMLHVLLPARDMCGERSHAPIDISPAKYSGG